MTKPLFSWRQAILESDLPPTTRHVLLTLSCYMNDVGQSCFPSTARLARETGLTKRTVITHLHKSRELGWITIGLHGFGGQNWRSHEYALRVPEGGETRSPRQKKGGESVSKGGESDDKKVVKEVHPISPENSTKNSHNGVALPDFVDQEAWEGYLEVRQRMKAPNTSRAKTMLVNKLIKLKEEGHDPNQALDTATERGWRSVFPPKDNDKQQTYGQGGI